MEDIARLTGMSRMTVSRVLSNTGPVSENTRARIIAAAKKLDYQMNMLARQLSSNRTSLLGVVLPFSYMVGSDYFGQVLKGIHAGLAESGYHIALFDCESEQFNDGRKCANLCRQRRVDGMIVIAPASDDRYPQTFANLQMPVIVVGSSLEEKSVSFIDVDNRGGAAAAVEHLIGLGHSKIGYLGGPEFLRDALQRHEAFRRTMRKHRIPVVEKWVIQAEFLMRKAFHHCVDIFRQKDRPTAIFAANDLMAFGAIDAARACGLRVPDDLSVVGFDDSEACTTSVPAMTTIRQPMRELGATAAKYLLKVVENPKLPVLQQQLETLLVVRASTAPLPRKNGRIR